MIYLYLVIIDVTSNQNGRCYQLRIVIIDLVSSWSIDRSYHKGHAENGTSLISWYFTACENAQGFRCQGPVVRMKIIEFTRFQTACKLCISEYCFNVSVRCYVNDASQALILVVIILIESMRSWADNKDFLFPNVVFK